MPPVLRLPIIASLALLGLVGAAPARDDGAAALAGLHPGHSARCMPDYRTYRPIGAAGTSLIYPITRSLAYVSRTTGGCEGVAHGDLIVVRQIGVATCAGDIGMTIDPVSRRPTGSCTFGPFVEYRR